MGSVFSLFRGLRGKLILTYTLVTVLALLALELVVLIGMSLLSSLTSLDLHSYLEDVGTVLAPQARLYLEPGREDLPGLQAWLEEVYASGYASLEPQYIGDSPAALIAPEEPLFVLSPQGTVLAQAPRGENDLIGRQYRPPDYPGSEDFLERALDPNRSLLDHYILTPDENYLVAVPLWDGGAQSLELWGVLVLTVQPPPSVLVALWPNLAQTWPVVFMLVLATGLVLLVAVAPFGALFGLIMSRGLTRRLRSLAQAADSWSQGDFTPMPQDRSKDEIGYLGLRMRHMAERIQSLLQSQQELAALEERSRLARELHDTVKQQTFATLMQVRAARNLVATDPQEASVHLEEAENLLKTAQGELGRLIAELRPGALEGQGLPRALEGYLQTWQQYTRIPAQLQVRNERSLPLEVEQALFRVVQEALANVARHSRASAVNVNLEYAPEGVSLSIVDNGVGFDPGANGRSGFGLQSMKERAEALGGSLEVRSSPENGTEVLVWAPRKEHR